MVLEHSAGEALRPEDPENYARTYGTATLQELPLPPFEVDAVFSKRKARTKYGWMTYAQLQAEQVKLRKEGDADGALKVALAINEKASTAVAVLAFALIAVPLGIKVSRKETSANLGVALLLVMGYYFLTIVVSWLEKSPERPSSHSPRACVHTENPPTAPNRSSSGSTKSAPAPGTR